MLSRKHLAIFAYFCGVSIFCITFGILSILLWSVLYDAIIRSQLVVKPGSASYDVWIKSSVPMTMKFYMFNWTNPEEIYNSTSKPRFQQIGPYVYRETKEKTDVTWNSNDTVTFKHLKRWWFDQELSNGSVYDPLTTINPLVLSAAFVARNWHYLMKKGLSMSLRTMVDSLAVTKSVGQVLYTGYDDPLLDMASKIPFLSLKSLPFKEKFGWFYARNNSADYEGVYEMNTGLSGQVGEMRSWNYANHTPFYPGSCGDLEGSSAGEFFPKDLTKTSIIKLFSSDMCRFMELEFEEEVVINGLTGYKFSAGERFLDNGTNIPENKCFCDGNCMPSGAVNVSRCRYGSPAFVSLPHFYKADPYYVNSIEGMASSKEKSSFYIVFEPKTGLPLKVAARLQLNLRLQPIEGISLFDNVPTVYFPVLYFAQELTMPDSITSMLKLLVNLQYICMAVGIIAISIGIFVSICVAYKISASNVFGKNIKETSLRLKEEQPLNQ